MNEQVKTTHVVVSKPKLGWRVVLTLIVFMIGFGTKFAYQQVQGPLESEIALKQANGSNADYAVGAAMARSDIPGWIATGTVLFIFLVFWLPYGFKLYRYLRAEAVPVPSRRG